MNDNHRLRELLAAHPRLTADEISEALGWTAVQVRNVISGLVHRGEGFSLPKRYELTPLGKSRARKGGRITLTVEERREKSIQRMEAFRDRQKAKKEEAERQEISAANESMVQRARASQPALALVWGGAHA